MIEVSTVLGMFVYLYCCVALFRISGRAETARGRLAARFCAVTAGLFCVGVVLGSGKVLLISSAVFIVATIPMWALYLLGRKIAAGRNEASAS
jgi:hypothetical protein